MNYLSNFGSELISILTEMAPYLLLGFFFAGLLHLLFPKDKVRQYMGGSNAGSIVNAALFGVPLPLCSCGVIPTSVAFYRHGASKPSTVSFLISTPQTGVDSILVTYSLLGLPFAIVRPIVALITGIFGGLITARVDKNSPADAGTGNDDTDKIPSGFLPKIREMFRYSFVEFLQDISNWLLLGLLLAAIISVFVPDNYFADKIPNNFVGMLIALLIAGPIYVCATASVPVAAALMLKGLSPGAALVLLMAGPATNIATMTMVGKVLGKKSLISYLGTIIGGAMLFGLFIDTFLPREWFALSEHYGHMHHAHEWMPDWLKIGSAVLLLLLILNGYIKKYLIRNKMTQSDEKAFNASEIKVIHVGGMSCNHCKANVENSIRSVKGVENVIVDLASGQVSISGKSVDLAVVKSGIESIGYTYSEEKP
ncbi:MAG TPA: permease [Bacteroidales bacterium]|nr:permease [Bacteroidales bacterium]